MKLEMLSLRLIDQSKPVTIFVAKKVITMNPEQPEAQSVAVQGESIVGVGDFDTLSSLLKANKIDLQIDTRFSESYIYPGFSEHHMHPQMLGCFLKDSHYVGFVDRKAADGSTMAGIQSVEKLIECIKELIEIEKPRLESSESEWLNCWGFDPLLLKGADITRDVLDKVSTDFPICVCHASGHVININSLGIELAGYENLPADPNLLRDENGRVTGTVAEIPMMQHAMAVGALKMDFSPEGVVAATEIATKVARINGCTSVTDKGTNMPLMPGNLSAQAWLDSDKQGRTATRVVLEPWFSTIDNWNYNGKTGWEAIHALKNEYNSRLTIGNFKMITDGSIQGYTANLLPDQNYKSGAPNGTLLMPQETIGELVTLAESHGFSCSIHTNGNGATEAAIQAIENIRNIKPNYGFRHSLEHCQMATENQFFRMNKLDVTPNLFANHIYYWGDVHSDYVCGDHGVRRMDACRSAVNHGLKHGLHSDDMVTEVSPLFAAWCACNRVSLSGKIYGEDQCLTVYQAIRAITYNHAWLAHQEDVRGTIETGKWADFTVLSEEATEARRETLKEIKIVATVIGADDIFIN